MTPTFARALALALALGLAACSQPDVRASAPATAPAPAASSAAAAAAVGALVVAGRSRSARPPATTSPQGATRPPRTPAEPSGGAAAAPSVVPPGERCAAAPLPPFPWPNPPEPSATATIAPYLLGDPAGGRPKTLAAVATRLEDAISRAGYLQARYLGAGCDGFAIVLDLEHIEADGTRVRGAAGFAPPSQEKDFSLASYVRRLFYAPPGQYRQIVFVISDLRMGRTTPPPTEAELRAIARDGLSALPAAYAALPYTPRHVVLALIYEFEKGPQDGDAKVIPPQGRLGATVHLKKAQLF